jgi:hypothetical protein
MRKEHPASVMSDSALEFMSEGFLLLSLSELSRYHVIETLCIE